MASQQELLALINKRINKTTNLIKEEGADGLLIFSQPNYRFLTNFTGEEAELIVTAKGDRVLLSDSRFKDQIKHQAPGEMKVVMQTMDVIQEVAKQLKLLDLKNVLVEGEFITATQFEALKLACPDIKFTLSAELVEKVRTVKDELELSALQQAINISMESFKQILPLIKPGVSEREIGAKLDYFFKVNGGDGPSFDTIVASGYRSSWAHGVASDKKIAKGELVVIDFGSFYNGYTADITRTVAVGKVEPELEKIYKIVLEAQRRGIEAAIAGNYGRDIDKAGRSYINEQGYGEYFGHGIGHGIGLELHELCTPAMPYAKEILKDNMAITVEPGIYLPDRGGVRIEDDILIKENTPITISNLPKDELMIL
ncbi:Xaa-Pro peptidase family protein [Lactobacillus sp.]|uniref:aminopeptidase P family protein n=1 Tax=Lactobacillus sp. TaxID=1591 RepID=UPI0019B8F649|nr:Xaa-Pro peptidase family protein [Lactobacillus sp.]MBD5428955.1 aminopeptidase P family protein [Lactobacillus sp.]